MVKKIIKKIDQIYNNVLQQSKLSNTKKMFVFCESMHATGTSPWHIRKLTNKGLKLGGGADTKALCKREMAWDLNVEITQHHLSHCCQKCAKIFRKRFDNG